jgi:hypothetical protein
MKKTATLPAVLPGRASGTPGRCPKADAQPRAAVYFDYNDERCSSRLARQAPQTGFFQQFKRTGLSDFGQLGYHNWLVDADAAC